MTIDELIIFLQIYFSIYTNNTLWIKLKTDFDNVTFSLQTNYRTADVDIDQEEKYDCQKLLPVYS
jgi:hypothetical protein